MATDEKATSAGTQGNLIENDRITSGGGSDGGSDIKKDLTSEKRYDIDIESQDDNVGKVEGQTDGALSGDDIERDHPRHITMGEILEKRSFSLFYRKFNVFFHIAYFMAMTASVPPLLAPRCFPEH